MVCILELPFQVRCNKMQMKEAIEDIVTRELRGLCTTCVHADRCIYHKTATRIIIQCELFQLDPAERIDANSLQGLCTTCDHASHCRLPGRKYGIWHCNEFR
jgi:hypothetical protein